MDTGLAVESCVPRLLSPNGWPADTLSCEYDGAEQPFSSKQVAGTGEVAQIYLLSLGLPP